MVYNLDDNSSNMYQESFKNYFSFFFFNVLNPLTETKLHLIVLSYLRSTTIIKPVIFTVLLLYDRAFQISIHRFKNYKN